MAFLIKKKNCLNVRNRNTDDSLTGNTYNCQNLKITTMAELELNMIKGTCCKLIIIILTCLLNTLWKNVMNMRASRSGDLKQNNFFIESLHSVRQARIKVFGEASDN